MNLQDVLTIAKYLKSTFPYLEAAVLDDTVISHYEVCFIYKINEPAISRFDVIKMIDALGYKCSYDSKRGGYTQYLIIYEK